MNTIQQAGLGSPKRALPRLDTTNTFYEPMITTTACSTDTPPIETRLVQAIGDILGIDPESVQMVDSFTDLGGCETTADALKSRCKELGLEVETRDILSCVTLAQLQTCITPAPPAPPAPPKPRILSYSHTPAILVNPLQLPLQPPPRASAVASAVPSTAVSEFFFDHESFICDEASVLSVAIIKPRAGLFDGKQVVFLALRDLDIPWTPVSDIELVPQTHLFLAGTKVAAIKHNLEAAAVATDLPDAWIVIRDVPRNELGAIDRRKLRTWAQNLNEETYQHIMSMHTDETLQEPLTDMERSLQRAVSKALKAPLDHIGMNFTFAQLGGDAVGAMQMVARSKADSIYLSSTEVLQNNTLAQLASLASTRGDLSRGWEGDSDEIHFALSPMQQLYFQTAMGGDVGHRSGHDGSYRFNQSLLLKLKRNFTLDDISAALDAIVSHHAMLRSRFSRTASGGWDQRIASAVDDCYKLRYTTIRNNKDLEALIEETQALIDIENGPVFAVDHIHTMDNHQMLYLAAHHLVVDLLSWRVIIQDLDDLLQNGTMISHKSMSFQRWNELQRKEIEQIDISSPLPAGTTAGNYAYWGLQDVSNNYADALEAGFSLSAELTTILHTTCNRVFGTESADIYLAALLLSFSQTFQDRAPPVIWNQEHGRDVNDPTIDITDTVGWFTTMSPLGSVLQDGTDDFLDILRLLKDVRRAMPRRGAQYFASKFFKLGGPNLFTDDWPFEMIFSFAGSLQQLERENSILEQLPVPGRTLASKTADIGPNVGRIALFEVSAMVSQGSSKIKLLYNRQSRHQDLIKQWIQNFEHLMLEAIGRLRYHEQELTMADVPQLDVTYAGLQTLNYDRVAALNLGSVRDIETVYPVTAMQQSILVRQAVAPESSHLHAIYEFSSAAPGGVDIGKLCTAWQNVTAKHAALRTIFIDSVTETGVFDQLVLRRISPNMLFIDVQPGEDPIEALNNLPMLPNSGTGRPQHRLAVCKAPTKTLVKLDINEALCDPQSVNAVMVDLRRAYGTGQALPELTGLTYPDYLKFLETARTSHSLDFWIERMSGAESCIFPRLVPKQTQTRYENMHFELDIDSATIIEFARSRKVSPDAVLRLAWAIVLRAYVGKDAVCFGYRASGREAVSGGPSMRNAVGCFGNVVACNFVLSPDTDVSDALRLIEDEYVASLRHQHVSIPEIHHVLRKRASERFFNTLISLTSEPAELNNLATDPNDLKLRALSHRETSFYDIAIYARFHTGKLNVDIGSMSMLSDKETINLATTLTRALQSIMETPAGPIQAVDLFTDHDYAQVVAWTNERPAPEPRDVLLHELVEKHAHENPHSVAVCAWDGDLTYQKLDELSSRLAARLVDAGVAVGVTVPVVLDKSVWSPVAMLAVLKAGGAFVPIDASDLSLIQSIFEHTDSKVVIECENTTGALGNLFDRVIVLNSELMTQLQLQAPRGIECLATEEDVACVFFMPSSSKEVKGIAFSHGALSTALLTQGPAADISSSSRVMQLSSFNVDIAIAEIFTTLINGGCICIPSEAERVLDFTGAVQRMEVTWSYMTPLLSRKLKVDLLPTLKTICFRTRALDEDTYTPWAGKKRVLFAYGAPDICPMGISFLEVFGTHELNRIGAPLAGNFWIVNPDDHRKLMPIGGVGELVVEGPTLGAGFYKGQVDQTHWNAAEFTTNNPNKKTRYFKTGHRVRYTVGGNMQLVSSKQDDIELDGKTIVLSEVEQHIRRSLGPGMDVVAEAIAFKGSKSVPVLAAFVELGSMYEGSDDLQKLHKVTRDRTLTARRLAETGMRHKLPAYMMPQIFVPVKHLPVTSSLKVNRRKLLKIIHGLSREQLLSISTASGPSDGQGTKQLPLNQTQERMRHIWAHVLNVEDETTILADDGFIKSGGDDILAAKLLVCCRQEGMVISIASVLADATLTDLCRSMTTIEAGRGHAYKPSAAPSAVSTVTTASREVTPTGPNPARANATPPPAAATPAAGPPVPAAQTAPIASSRPQSNSHDERLYAALAAKVGVETQIIKDVAEASSMQTRHIESGMLRGRANINYFVFSFSGPVDHKQLEEACQMLATIHPILRTAFVPHRRKMYQVVFRSQEADFKRYLCPSWRLAAFAEKVIKKDQSTPLAFSAPMTKFILLDGGKQSTLLLRLSKAQYDDLSVALLVKDLKKLYDGAQNPPRRPGYTEFMRCAQLTSRDAESYWKSLLEGATMTQVVAHSRPYQLTNHVKTIRQRVVVPSLGHLGMSFETVLKAAWAMTLATLSGSGDVVFGEVVDGRQIRLSGGQSVAGVLGPTANMTAVRVRFPEGDERLSPLELLQYVHGQRIAGIPFENYGLLDLVERCTPWPYWTRFSTLVQHQYEETTVAPSEPKVFHLGKGGDAGALCKFSIVESRAQDVPDIFVHSMARGGGINGGEGASDVIELCITFCESRIPVSFAEETLRMLVGNVGFLTSGSIMQPIVPSAAQYKAMRAQIPLPQVPSMPTSSLAVPDGALSLSGEQMAAIKKTIAKCWAGASLDPTAVGVPEASREHAAFYDLWGSMVPASQLASFITREIPRIGIPGVVEGQFTVSMEDITDSPTMARQFDMVTRKIASLSMPAPKSAPLLQPLPSPGHRPNLSLDSAKRYISSPVPSPGRNRASNAVSKLANKIMGGSSGQQGHGPSHLSIQHLHYKHQPQSAPPFKSTFQQPETAGAASPRHVPAGSLSAMASPMAHQFHPQQHASGPRSPPGEEMEDLELQLERALNEIGRGSRAATERDDSSGSAGVESLTDGSSAADLDFDHAVLASLPGYFGTSSAAPTPDVHKALPTRPLLPAATFHQKGQYKQKFYGGSIAVKTVTPIPEDGRFDEVVSPVSPPTAGGHRRFHSHQYQHRNHQRGDSSMVTPVQAPPPPYRDVFGRI